MVASLSCAAMDCKLVPLHYTGFSAWKKTVPSNSQSTFTCIFVGFLKRTIYNSLIAPETERETDGESCK